MLILDRSQQQPGPLLPFGGPKDLHREPAARIIGGTLQVESGMDLSAVDDAEGVQPMDALLP